MTSAARQPKPMTLDAFLAFLDARPEDERWELIDGEPVMMGGGTLSHSTIALNIVAALRPAAKRSGCRVFSDVIVRERGNDVFGAVPDVFVYCGSVTSTDRMLDSPSIIVEVLSPSTLRHDRGVKLERYRAMPSVDQIVHVYQDQVRIEIWTRARDDEPGALEGWHFSVLTGIGETARFRAVGAEVPVADIYDDAVPEPAASG